MNYSVLAMQNLLPKAQFSWGDPYKYEDINWLDSRAIPAKEEWETEKARLIAFQPKQDCKDKAKILIANCDWSVLADVQIQNKSEFIAYREILRNYILNPVENPVFPPEPQPIWINN